MRTRVRTPRTRAPSVPMPSCFPGDPHPELERDDPARPVVDAGGGRWHRADPLDWRRGPVKGAGESRAAHRALLLYLMQDPERRSYRRVATAIARGDSTVRKWAKLYAWQARTDACGEAAQQLAIRRYIEEYREHGTRDISVIEDRMSVPYRPDLPPPPGPGEQGLGEAAKAELQRAITNGSPEADSNRTQVSRFAKLLEAMLVNVAHQLDPKRNGGKAAKVPISLVPRMIDTWNDLQVILGHQAPQGAAQGVGPTWRVIQAEQRGESVTKALLADAEQCVAVLRGIHASEAVAAEVEQVRAEAGA